MKISAFAAAVFTLLLFGKSAIAQTCVSRGELSPAFCDANQDLVADAPKITVNPAKVVLAISSVEDSATSRRTYMPLLDYLSSCLKKDVELYPPVRVGAVLEAQRTGLVHIGQYGTGNALYAVNFAGAIPFANRGRESSGRSDTYTLRLLVRADSTARQPTDLKGKKLAHTSLGSNSGNLAPRVLFPDLGLRPDIDYKVEYSGGHDKSILGVKLGLYDAAAVGSDALDRMLAKGDVKASDFRVLYESEPFPGDVFAFSHNLDPKLQDQIRSCFADFRFPEAMVRQLENTNRFYPVEYKKDWAIIRKIASSSGNSPTQANYQKILGAR